MTYTTGPDGLLWKGKPARAPKSAVGRLLAPTLATDGRTLFFSQRKLPARPGFDLTRARARDVHDNPVNLFGAVLTDDATVRVIDGFGRHDVLEGADFDTVAPLTLPDGGTTLMLRDARHVWCLGRRIDWLDAGQARALGKTVATDGTRVWAFGDPLPDMGADAITMVRTGRSEPLPHR